MTPDAYPTSTTASPAQASAPAEGATATAQPTTPEPAAVVPNGSAERRQRVAEPSVHYNGFRSTEEGREYRLRVAGVPEGRELVVLVSHAAFAARLLSYQDAPSLCFARVKRALAADPGLLPGAPLVLSSEELADYRLSGGKAATKKKPVPGHIDARANAR